MQFHASLRCFKRTGDPDDPDAMEQNIVRCAPNWQGRVGNGRYDWIWVQEFAARDPLTGADAEVAFQGRLPARVRYVVSIEDSGQTVQQAGTPRERNMDREVRPGPRYTGVFVDLAGPKNAEGLADDDHGMTVITPMPPAPWRGLLRGRRIFALRDVIHSIHVVPVDETQPEGKGDLYINNTADFEDYNFLWNSDWECEEARQACAARDKRKAAVLAMSQTTANGRANVGGKEEGADRRKRARR